MNLQEIHPFRLRDAIKFHDTLNPKLWWGSSLQPRVRDTLMKIARDFVEYLGVDKLNIKDVTISGSNAAYSYTQHSDIDLHIVVDMDNLNPDSVYRELFSSKKQMYNTGRKITIHGIPVECYVQDSSEPARTLGEYSVLKKKWIKYPTKSRAHLDHRETRLKYEKLRGIVERAIKTRDSELINALLKKIAQYRSAGLARGGEFGPENLSYKALRAGGTIDKLYALRDRLRGRDLSIESQHVGENTKQDANSTLFESFKKILVNSRFDYSNIPSQEEYYNNPQIKKLFDQRVFRYCWESCNQGENYIDIFARVKSSWRRTLVENKNISIEIKNLIQQHFHPLDTSDIRPNMTGDLVTVEHKSDNIFSIHVQKNKTIAEIAQQKDGSILMRTTDNEIFPSNWDAIGHSIDVYFVTSDADKIIQWIELATERVDGKRYYRGFIIDLPKEGPFERLMSRLKEEMSLSKPTPTVEELAKKYDTTAAHVKQQLERGITVELEHTNSRKTAREIALDHLGERLDYYKQLSKVGLEEATLYRGNSMTPTPTELVYVLQKKEGGVWKDIAKYRGQNADSDSTRALEDLIDSYRESDQEPPPLDIAIKRMPRTMYEQKDKSKVIIDAHRVGNSVIIDYFEVSPRLSGIGTKRYMEWENRLPRDITTIKLHASDAGEGSSEGFWDRMGFDWMDEASQWMIKKLDRSITEASGYIPSECERNDPRFKTALSVDVTPNSIRDNARKLGMKVARDGRPPLLRKSR